MKIASGYTLTPWELRETAVHSSLDPIQEEVGTNSIEDRFRDDAQMPQRSTSGPTSATKAAVSCAIVSGQGKKLEERWADRPSYARDFVWGDDEPPLIYSIRATESMTPLPGPPVHELSGTVALKTIKESPHLFKIVTPINVDRFEQYLAKHPNRKLVKSVCRGLRDGFWPFAETNDTSSSKPSGTSHRPLKDATHIKFSREQRDREIRLGRFSEALDLGTLPGTSGMPVEVTLEPYSDKLRLASDHNAEPHALNFTIPQEAVLVRYDNIKGLGCSLGQVRKDHRDAKLVLCNSRVSQACRLLPVHPLWQIRQIVSIDGQRYVDRCMDFNNRATGRLWYTFMSLVLWIAVSEKRLTDLFTYEDSCFSWEFDGNTSLYEPYQKLLPAKQAELLRLWDELDIPHEEEMQYFGSTLCILGFHVDPNAMTVTIPPDALSNLVLTIRQFAQRGGRRSIHDFQRLAGWVNWALDAYPLLRPGLSILCDKMRGKKRPSHLVSISDSLSRELLWLADRMTASGGVHSLTSMEWSAENADHTLEACACGTGIAYWSPTLLLGFQSQMEEDLSIDRSFLSALAIVSALHYAVQKMSPRPSRLTIITNDSAVSEVFTSLRAPKPAYNSLLLTAVDLLIEHQLEMRVVHKMTPVAYVLSHFDNDIARRVVPGLSISTFKPPTLGLGVIRDARSENVQVVNGLLRDADITWQ